MIFRVKFPLLEVNRILIIFVETYHNFRNHPEIARQILFLIFLLELCGEISFPGVITVSSRRIEPIRGNTRSGPYYRDIRLLH